MQKLFFLLLFTVTCARLQAAVQPVNNAVLNYTQVMFEFEEQEGADRYMLSLYQNAGDIHRNIKTGSLACLVREGLEFGQRYYWYFTAFKNDKTVFKSSTFSFSIAENFLIDATQFRYNVLQQKTGAYQDNIIFIDYLGVAIDRRGRPVWYMPYDSAEYLKAPEYRNLQMTHTGTFTFLKGDQCWEKDRSGYTVWRAPDDGIVSGDKKEHYHHDFEKLKDGSYMACSYQFADMPCFFDTAATCRVRYNTVIEYKADKVQWQWNERDHTSSEALFRLAGPDISDIAGTHMNGFSFDRKNKTAVFSFRNNNALLWVNTQNGKVIHRLQGDDSLKSGIQFTGQHSPVLLANGDLLVYNNNGGGGRKSGGVRFPKILILKAPGSNKPAQKIWEYECRMNEYPDGLEGKEGYAGMLPNGNVLVCVGGANKIFEVTRGKKIVWEMNCSRFSAEKNGWTPFVNYRSHFASSLYPDFYTVQKITRGNTVRAGQQLQVKINNDGTDAGAYKVEMFSSGLFTAYSKKIVILPAKSQVVNIVLTKAAKKSYENNERPLVIVRITSLNNTEAVKDIQYSIAD
jgi:Arylsulfotransferase (ASST)